MSEHKHTSDQGHDHGHSHGAGGHDHAPSTDTADGRRRVAIAAVLTFAFMGVEIVGAVISGSLALLADAAHMLTDAGSLALAWLGYKFAERPADETRSYGFGRLKILAAFTNGIALLALAAWIFYEAITRLMSPQPVLGGVMLIVAIGGLIVNLIAFAVLHGGDKEDLNMQGALWHVAGDLLGSVAAILAAIIIMWTSWTPIDPILSMLVAGLVGFAGWRIARASGHILLEGAPEGLTSSAIRDDLLSALPNIEAVQHVHAWALTEAKPLVTLEILARPGACTETLRCDVKARLESAFGVHHATVEILTGDLTQS